MGRHAKTLEFHLHNGNKSHLTKDEIESRKTNQISLGEATLQVPKIVRDRPDAWRKWKELIRIYKDTELVTTADIGAITRYCLLWADYEDLQKIRKTIVLPDQQDLFGGIHVIDHDVMLKIDTAINKKSAELLKLEERLYLNPLSRVKSLVNKPQEAPADPLGQMGLGGL